MDMEQTTETEPKESSPEQETAFLPPSICPGKYRPGDTVTLKVVAVEDDGTVEVAPCGSGQDRKSYEDEIDNLPEDE